MPTENRSSNTEMVSFPRELSDDLAELIVTRARVCGGGAFEIWEAICEGFGKPAEQNYGEPVAWCQPHWSGKYADYSWGAERPNAAFPELWKPLYTNADPGEVTLQQIMRAYEYAESHPHQYLRGTTNWCAAVAWHVNKNRGAQSGE